MNNKKTLTEQLLNIAKDLEQITPGVLLKIKNALSDEDDKIYTQENLEDAIDCAISNERLESSNGKTISAEDMINKILKEKELI